jgi:outer membrane protein TolC
VREVESSLVVLAEERARLAATSQTEALRRTGLRHAESMYREGQIGLLPLLDAQRSVITAELAAIDSRTQLALGAVQLFKSMGGGWLAEPDAAAHSSAPPAPEPVPATGALLAPHLETDVR